MKKENIILISIAGGAGVLLLFKDKIKESLNLQNVKEKVSESLNSSTGGGSKNNPNKVFNKLKKEYKNDEDSLQLLNTAERIMRLESAHFTSNIYKKTLGGAFVVPQGKESYPFGFSSPKSVWEQYGKPKDFYSSSNGLNYIIFPNLEVGVRSIIALLRGYYSNGHTTGHYHGGDPMYVDKLNEFDDSKLFTESFANNPYLVE